MELTDSHIKKILLEQNYVTLDELKKAEEFAKEQRSSIVDYLLSEELITKDLLGQAIAESFKVPYADLNSNPPPQEQVLKIPQEIAEKYRVVLFKEEKDTITITTDNPKQTGLMETVRTVFGRKKVVLAYSLPKDIDEVFVHYRKALKTRFDEIIKTEEKIAPEIVDEIIKDALAFHASDMHFEPQEEEIVIRFRIDGVLHEAGRISKKYYGNILNRIKIQSNLRIDEHAATQDGAIRLSKDGKKVDMRVSIVPAINGEKVVIRLLAEYVRGFTLTDIGLSQDDQKRVSDAARKPFGMILAAGPTGSGKTTTLYSLIKILNRPEVNITTIEDPVEYKIIGATQIQVNTQTDLTFAKGLRSIVRQDPDIILVGEIRDSETAEIAVNAALTGHLLFSTFHANDAATTVPRLLDMGVEPFLLASTLELIVAQRLARRICESCRYSYSEKRANLEKLLSNANYYFPEDEVTLYKGKGCNACGGVGYKGRIGIFELITVTPEMKDLILKSPSTKQIWEQAKNQGARSLFENGIEKVKSGATSLEELLRVVSPS